VIDRAERERMYWNRLRSEGEAVRSRIDKYYSIGEPRLNAYRAILDAYARGGARMLELGCSNGSRSIELSILGADVVGVDVSDVAIRRARDSARSAGARVQFDVGDAERMAYEDRSFDIVFGSSVIHHLDVSRVAPEIARVTRDGGTAVFLEPLGHNPVIGLYRRLTPDARTADERPLRAPDLRRLQADWRQSNVTYYDCLTLCAVPFRSKGCFRGVDGLGRRLDSLLFRIPAAWRLAWFSLIELHDPRGG
jgi:SAM-dependent methyltransferase